MGPIKTVLGGIVGVMALSLFLMESVNVYAGVALFVGGIPTGFPSWLLCEPASVTRAPLDTHPVREMYTSI